MSLSSPQPAPAKVADAPQFVSGRVFMGAGSDGAKCSTVAQLERDNAPIWDAKVGEEYLARVRAKAQEKAREIITGAMKEAEDIRQEAYDLGFKEGARGALAEAQALREQMAASLESVLTALAGQGRTLLERQARDIETLVRLATHKVIGLEMDERRAEILGALLTQAVEAVESKRKLVLTVNPRDHELLAPLLEVIQASNPNLGSVRIVNSTSIEDGGLKLESEGGLVDNTLATRRAEVDAVLEQLCLTMEDGIACGMPEEDEGQEPA